jgi:hypothetical protein
LLLLIIIVAVVQLSVLQRQLNLCRGHRAGSRVAGQAVWGLVVTTQGQGS